MKRLIALSVSIGAALILAACGSGSDNDAPSQPSPTASVTATATATAVPDESPAGGQSDIARVYTNEVVGFSLSYPGDWTVTDEQDVITLIHAGGSEVIITLEPLEGIALDDYATLFLGNVGDRAGDFIETSRLPLTNPSRILVVGETTSGGEGAQVSSIVANHVGTAVTITSVIKNGAVADVQAMVDDILASVTFFTPIALTADSHGNLPATATRITQGVVTSGIIVAPDDVDFFSFEARRGQTYAVSVVLGGLSDSLLGLYTNGGACNLTQNDDADGSFASRIVWRAPDDGPLFVSVANADASSIGSYTLLVQESTEAPTDDHGDALCSATVIQLGTAIQGDIGEPGDIDVLTFQAAAGTAFEIAFDEETLNFPFVGLFAGDGTVLEVLRDQDAVSTSPTIWTAPTSGTYYIIVENADNLDTGSYQLTLTESR